jgi:VanZ family protein
LRAYNDFEALAEWMGHLPGGRYPPAVHERSSLASRARGFSAWLPAIAWAGLIFALSAQPDLRFAPDAELDFVVRKIGHMGVFAILALLLLRALTRGASSRPSAWSFTIAAGYAASDELHQALVAGRHPSVVDVAIDAAGALIALTVVGIIRSRRS